MTNSRLYGRRRCSNCYWFKDGVCWFQTHSKYELYCTTETSWCPDWYSRNKASKDGDNIDDFIHKFYKEVKEE